ncbi:alpha/beta hydrolase [Niabella sp. CC-SYL272]|uniref:alpha/beta hydrolase-fold protein n=1 Tax=Niabella agricola TaxID=2891571 RepID=UPI001EEA3729|nr:alpha/beta hydrolase-fold protein [Niabella agricola]MCF3108989.1 alpha/beta hydrolase [Niabella agricola]
MPLQAQDDNLPQRDQKKVVFTSKILNEQRSLWIYTPANYQSSREKYPVLYLLDPDQNFAYVTELERFLSDRYRIPQLIVVGIVNNDRKKDFTPIHSLIFNGRIDSSLATTGGGKDFLNFIKNELIPYVDRNYRTQPYRILSGHSLGGLFAVYCKEADPGLFQSEIVISPAIYGGNMEILGRFSGFLRTHSELTGYLSLSLGNEPGGKLAADSLVTQLKQFAPKFLKWQYNTYMNEDHFSVGYKSMYDGLRFIFGDWFINPQDTASVRSYQDIALHFARLSKQYGYTIQAPEDFMNECGYQRLNGGHVDQAIEIFARNVENHPGSSNAYDSLGEAYYLKGDLKSALKNYRKSVLLNPQNQNGKNLIRKIEDKLQHR